MEKNLGHATAYGYAKSKGYSGTEEEFAELMADYASVGQSAAQSAEQAAASATSASGSATTASQAAQTATAKASDAVTAAGTATTKASEANQSASTASAAATSAGTSAQTATAKAGTATAKADEAAASEAAALSAKTDAESARDAAAQSASRAEQSAESIDPDEFNSKIYAAFATDTATGAIASFTDGADSIPMKDVLVHIEPVQEGSGDPSPDNVRPITGWTGAKVTRTGKNLAQFTNGKGLDTNGRIHNINNRSATVTPIMIVEGKRYKWYNTSEYACIYAVWNGDTLIRRLAGIPNGSILDTTDGKELYVCGYSSEYDNVLPEVCGVFFEDEFDGFVPYSGQTYDITFPTEAGTVYGGTLDVTKGELIVDRFLYVYDGTETGFSKSTTAINGFYNYMANDLAHGWPKMLNYNGEEITNEISSMFKTTRDISTYKQNYGYCFLDSGMNFNCDPSIFGTTVESFKAKLAELYENGTPVSAFVKLATPITYTLTPQEITSLLGTNNLWADTGDSEVEYRADTKLYITKKITEAVSALS